MSTTEQSDALDQSSLPLTEQVVRLQALLEASRAVHSTIELTDVLQQSARIAVRELELEAGHVMAKQERGDGRRRDDEHHVGDRDPSCRSHAHPR